MTYRLHIRTAWRIAVTAVAFASLFAITVAGAQVVVTPAISSAAGITTFDYSITNNTLTDLVIVSISVPAIPGAVFDLAAPVGFLTSFDSGVGIVDFIADTESFGAGATQSGFLFSSRFPAGPAAFTALDAAGTEITGSTVSAVVPEPGAIAWWLAAPALCIALHRRGAWRRPRLTLRVLQEENVS